MKIVIYPNKMLRAKCQPITKIDVKIKRLVSHMHKIMIENDGIGLSAPQINLPIQLIIAKYDRQKITLINPQITKLSPKKIETEEGCLSFPNLFANVTRPESVKIKGQNLSGKFISIKAKGLLCAVLQHEIDHLNGTLFIDKMDPKTLKYYDPKTKNDDEAKASKLGRQRYKKLTNDAKAQGIT